jgi:galactokinase/mevalonate kinase-like predicted kinase
MSANLSGFTMRISFLGGGMDFEQFYSALKTMAAG